MAGKEIGQFLYTAMAKGMSAQVGRLKSEAQHGNGADGGGPDGDGREKKRSTDEDQSHYNLKMFMDVVEDVKELLEQETGIGKYTRKICYPAHWHPYYVHRSYHASLAVL